MTKTMFSGGKDLDYGPQTVNGIGLKLTEIGMIFRSHGATRDINDIYLDFGQINRVRNRVQKRAGGGIKRVLLVAREPGRASL